jgi:hypothetical protein
VLVRAAIASVLLALAPATADGACRSVARCVASAPSSASFVATRPGGPIDATLQFGATGSVALVTLHGRRHWQAATTAGQPLQLSAAGDLNRDGTTDFVLWVLNPRSPAQVCGTTPMRVSSLLVVDGRSGRTASPFPSIPDICWDTPTFNYPTQQYDFGAVYIGDFRRASPGREVVLTPYYATEGTVWQQSRGAWARAAAFPFPSTPAFDQSYDAANPTPCSHPLPGGACFVTNSHVANGVFLPGRAAGFFVLTTARALIYRPDSTPTADTTWIPGAKVENGGRNYGLVETYRRRGRTYVDLIGGCSVMSTWRAMLPGASASGGDDNCGIVRHFERFAVAGRAIAKRKGRYYGYFGTEGAFNGRVEYPAHPRAPLGGAGTSWTAFNVLRGSRWTTQVFRGPMTTRPLSLRGWFVWDTVKVGKRAVLLATRVRPGQIVTPAHFNVLRWNGRRFRSVQHVAGAVPALLNFPPTERRHTLEHAVFGSFVRDVRGDDRRELLVASPSGGRRFVTLR